MKGFLYYFDKFTSWLDFSWLISKPQPKKYSNFNHSPPLLEPLLLK